MASVYAHTNQYTCCAAAMSVEQFILHYVQIILLKLFIQYVHIQINQYVTTSAVATEE